MRLTGILGDPEADFWQNAGSYEACGEAWRSMAAMVSSSYKMLGRSTKEIAGLSCHCY